MTFNSNFFLSLLPVFFSSQSTILLHCSLFSPFLPYYYWNSIFFSFFLFLFFMVIMGFLYTKRGFLLFQAVPVMGRRHPQQGSECGDEVGLLQILAHLPPQTVYCSWLATLVEPGNPTGIKEPHTLKLENDFCEKGLTQSKRKN